MISFYGFRITCLKLLLHTLRTVSVYLDQGMFKQAPPVYVQHMNTWALCGLYILGPAVSTVCNAAAWP